MATFETSNCLLLLVIIYVPLHFTYRYRRLFQIVIYICLQVYKHDIEMDRLSISCCTVAAFYEPEHVLDGPTYGPEVEA